VLACGVSQVFVVGDDASDDALACCLLLGSLGCCCLLCRCFAICTHRLILIYGLIGGLVVRYIDPSHCCSPYVGVDLLFDRDGDAVAESERFRDLVEHQLEHFRTST